MLKFSPSVHHILLLYGKNVCFNTSVSPACNDKDPFDRRVSKEFDTVSNTTLQFIIILETFHFHGLILHAKTIYTTHSKVLVYCTTLFTKAHGHSTYTHKNFKSCTQTELHFSTIIAYIQLRPHIITQKFWYIIPHYSRRPMDIQHAYTKILNPVHEKNYTSIAYIQLRPHII